MRWISEFIRESGKFREILQSVFIKRVSMYFVGLVSRNVHFIGWRVGETSKTERCQGVSVTSNHSEGSKDSNR